MATTKKTSSFALDIAQGLLKIGAVSLNVKTPFKWVSGIKSPIYCDNRKVNSNVALRNKVIDAFCDLIRSHFNDFDMIAGVATGGIPLGILVADRMDLPFIYVRQEPKEHGLMKQIEGSYKSGDKVIVIEDLISTGSSSLKAIEGLRREQIDVVGLISLMTYRFNSSETLFNTENVINYSVCDLDTIVDVAIANNSLSSEEKESIFSFRNDPKNWG